MTPASTSSSGFAVRFLLLPCGDTPRVLTGSSSSAFCPSSPNPLHSLSSTVMPSQRLPGSSPPNGQVHIGRLTLLEVLILKLWTLSHPPWIRATTAGMAAFRLDTTWLSLCEMVAIFIELRRKLFVKWSVHRRHTCKSPYFGAYR